MPKVSISRPVLHPCTPNGDTRALSDAALYRDAMSATQGDEVRIFLLVAGSIRGVARVGAREDLPDHGNRFQLGNAARPL